MVESAKPAFSYDYQTDAQLAALRYYRDNEEGRAIPSRAAGRLLVATWNIANLGVQVRRDKDFRLIAEMVSWFDLVAVQEVYDNLAWAARCPQPAASILAGVVLRQGGNDEEACLLLRLDSGRAVGEVGEMAFRPAGST